MSNHVDKKRNLVSFELSACREKQKSIYFQSPVYNRRFLSDFSFLLGLDCQTQTLVCNLLHLLWNTNYFMEKTQTTSLVSAQSLAPISVKRPALVSNRALKVFLRHGQDDNLATDEGQLRSSPLGQNTDPPPDAARLAQVQGRSKRRGKHDATSLNAKLVSDPD